MTSQPIDESTAQVAASYARLFAATVALDPTSALREVGWLEPEVIPTLEVRTFWARLKAGDSLIAAAQAVGPGFHKALSGWLLEVPDFADVREYAHQMEQAAYYSHLAGLAVQMAVALGKGEGERIEQIKRQFTESRQGGKAESLPAHVSLEHFMAALDHVEGRSLPIYIGGFDEATGGLERQGMTILAARPSMGKTAWAWQAAQMVAQNGGRALFFTLESSAISLWARSAVARRGCAGEICGRAQPPRINGRKSTGSRLNLWGSTRIICG